jgi:hypothetical protein
VGGERIGTPSPPLLSRYFAGLQHGMYWVLQAAIPIVQELTKRGAMRRQTVKTVDSLNISSQAFVFP